MKLIGAIKKGIKYKVINMSKGLQNKTRNSRAKQDLKKLTLPQV